MCAGFPPTGASEGTRIDGILADPRVATALEEVQPVRGSGIPGHRPLVFSLRLSRATQRVWRAVRPPVVTIRQRPEEQRRNLEDCLLSPLAADWEAGLESADVDAVWAYWTWAAEEALLALSDSGLPPERVDPACPLPVAPRAAQRTTQRGRGTGALVRQVRMCPRQHPVTGLPETAPLARLHAGVGALRPMVTWRTAPARPHVPPRAVEQAWQGARRRMHAVRVLRLPRSDALPDLPRLGEVPIPDAEHLEATIRDLRRLVRDEARREDAERVSAWKAWLVEEMSVRPGPVYRWLREEEFSPPVVFLPQPVGTPTGNVQEMDELLRAAWGPINRKYAEAPEPDPAAFLARYGHHLRWVPMLHKPLTGGYLRKRLRFMHFTALGLDGWSLKDLRSLPLRLLDWLAELLTLVEVTGRWPEVLARGYTALIPKPGEEGPIGTSPLIVLSVVYGLRAGTRVWEVLHWQETWAHPEAYGFRPARGALDAAAVTQVLLELSRLKGWTLFGVNLDYVKCFDLIPQAVVLRVGQVLGMEPGIVRALMGMYRQLRRAFKVSGCLGSWWRATNGILQGCPLRVILINPLTTVCKMEIDEMRRHVVVATRALPPIHGDQPDMVVHQGAGRAALCPTGYADDTQAMTRTSQDRQDVCDRRPIAADHGTTRPVWSVGPGCHDGGRPCAAKGPGNTQQG